MICFDFQGLRSLLVTGHARPGINPCPQQPYLLRSESIAFRRHFLLWILRSNVLDDRTFFTLSPNKNRFAGITTFQNAGNVIQPQPAFLLFRIMTLITITLKYRADVTFEIYRAASRRLLCSDQVQQAGHTDYDGQCKRLAERLL